MTQTTHRSAPWAKLLLALLIGATAGFFATSAWRGESPGRSFERLLRWAGLTQAGPGAVADGPLAASVLVGGSEHAAEAGRIALPTGTRFQLRLRSERAGTLNLYAISPDGRASAEPVWSTPVQGGATVVTPVLRLEGTQGLETLRAVLVGPGQDELARRDVQIWHL